MFSWRRICFLLCLTVLPIISVPVTVTAHNEVIAVDSLGFFNTGIQTSDVAVVGAYVYLVGGPDSTNGLRVISVVDPTNPVEVGAFHSGRSGRSICTVEDYAYVGDEDGLAILDVSEPTNPFEVGYLSCCTYSVISVAVNDDYAYIVSFLDAMRIIDVSDPTNPTEVGNEPGHLWDVAVSGDYAYLASMSGYLRVIDVSDHTDPVLVGALRAVPHPSLEAVAVSGSYAYLAHGYDGGLRVIDITDPTNPSEVGWTWTDDHAYDLSVSGDYVYVADYYGGLRVFHISDPTDPIEVGVYDVNNIAFALAVSGTTAYVLHDDGMYVLRFNPVATSTPGEEVRHSFRLYQNYPNPFNPSTRISFELSEPSHVRLSIFSVAGKLIRELVNEPLNEGFKSVFWDGRDSDGNLVSSGVYFYRLKAGGDVQSRKMILLE
jgi:hypothetical protein